MRPIAHPARYVSTTTCRTAHLRFLFRFEGTNSNRTVIASSGRVYIYISRETWLPRGWLLLLSLIEIQVNTAKQPFIFQKLNAVYYFEMKLLQVVNVITAKYIGLAALPPALSPPVRCLGRHQCCVAQRSPRMASQTVITA